MLTGAAAITHTDPREVDLPGGAYRLTAVNGIRLERSGSETAGGQGGPLRSILLCSVRIALRGQAGGTAAQSAPKQFVLLSALPRRSPAAILACTGFCQQTALALILMYLLANEHFASSQQLFLTFAGHFE